MNPKEIIKNNILIATKFMGMVFTPTKSILLDKTVKPQRVFKPEDLDYHSNWDSLIEVVEKAEKTHWVEIDGCNVAVTPNDNCDADGFEITKETKKIAVYEAMVLFVKNLD